MYCIGVKDLWTSRHDQLLLPLLLLQLLQQQRLQLQQERRLQLLITRTAVLYHSALQHKVNVTWSIRASIALQVKLFIDMSYQVGPGMDR